MRARLHVRGGRIGFFREGTHELCDVARDAAAAAGDVRRARSAGGGASIARRRAACASIELSENVDATERVVHLDARAADRRSDAARGRDALTAIGRPSTRGAARHRSRSPIGDGTRGRAAPPRAGVLPGQPFLLRDLVGARRRAACRRAATSSICTPASGCSRCAAAARGARVTAVEGDRIAARRSGGQRGGVRRRPSTPVHQAGRGVRGARLRGRAGDARDRRSAAHRACRARRSTACSRLRRAARSSTCRATSRRWRATPGGSSMPATRIDRVRRVRSVSEHAARRNGRGVRAA